MFIYTQSMKEIWLTIEFEQQHIKAFIDYCRDVFEDNKDELKNIDKLEQKYHHETPIWWYSYACFLYPMLNRALRTIDVDVIINIGFFICDLHRQIEQLHKEQFSGHQATKTFTVYRGQSLSKTDFEQMEKTKGGLMLFNSFLSTSKDQNVSLRFAHNALADLESVGILFVMTIYPSQSTTPFASINGTGYFQAEDQVLFSMHTIFRIQDIKTMGENQRLFQVDLILTDENDNELWTLTDHIREETSPKSPGWYRLGILLLKMGQSDRAQQVYQILLDQTTDEIDKAPICIQLGSIKCAQGEYDEALIYYEKAFEIYKLLPSNDPQFAQFCIGYGGVHEKMGKHSIAVTLYEKAIEIQKQALPSNHIDLAMSYNNMGVVYGEMCEYSKELSYYEKALEIQHQSLPPNHPSLAFSYGNISVAYQNMGEYSKALSYYEKALEIQQQSLSSNHPNVAMLYYNIGLLYEEMSDYSKARSFYEQAVNVGQHALSSSHPDLKDYRDHFERIKKKL